MSSSEGYFGVHAVQALLDTRPDQILEIWFQRGKRGGRIDRLIQQAEETGIPVRFVDRERLERKADGNHQGVVAIVREARVYRENELYELLDNLSETPFLLILDSITDPHNLGACLRSADAAGVHAVVVPKDNSAPLNGTARKIACGAADTVPLVTVTNLARTMRELKERGIWMIGTAGEASSNIYTTDLVGSLALVMGAEDKGMRRLTREHCDALVHLPMSGTVSSLNVSVATGVCLFEAVRQRIKA
ncbi:MAG: 23S rRNA (guanosine(2251)-2'-O)-methyltransferase RlmB [Oceanospirillales bacterium LUC14_002_19_P2]|nr:MAG: 23S rRNA (guanosine(2251)-2'-O)-methyltransferase RlmB [Oceanospirillales bacterium LUC14_002_19_P2]